MTTSAAITDQLMHSFANSTRESHPFRHWLFSDILPGPVSSALLSLPFAVPEIDDTGGKRETHNGSRTFFSPENREHFPVCAAIAESLRARPVIDWLETRGEIDLRGSYLRIEYCQDTEGFWLEPHTDIGAKLVTMLVYLSPQPEAVAWGTDLYDRDQRLVSTLPAHFNTGMLFIPAGDTWHGYHKRPMPGIRRTIIVNFVRPEWRSRHELAFPEEPIA